MGGNSGLLAVNLDPSPKIDSKLWLNSAVLLATSNENTNSNERTSSITKRSPEKSFRTTNSKAERKPMKRENNRSVTTTQSRSYKSAPNTNSRSSERSSNERKSSAQNESKNSSGKERSSNSSRRRG